MKVLVTGSRGYIGTVLVPMLLERDHEVMGLDTDLYRRCTFTGEVPPVKTLLLDVRDIAEDHLRGLDAIIHLAGLSNDPLGDFKPELTREINEIGSLKLAQNAKAAKVPRFLFASSCSNYGSAGSDFLTEESNFNPVTPYGVSKVRVEAGLSQMADDSFSPTYIRASTAYGVYPRLRFDLVTNNLAAWAHTTGRVYLKSDGTPWRPIVHIHDISLAYIAALEAPRDTIHNEAFNVGSTTENYQICEIAKMVKEIIPDCEIAYAPDASPDKRCYRVDCNKIAKQLPAFKPQWTLRRGILELYEEYRKIGLTVDEFEGPRYKRIAHIKALIHSGELDEDLRWKNGMNGINDQPMSAVGR